MRHMVYDGDSFYEIDEECLKKKEEEQRNETFRKKIREADDKPLRREEDASLKFRRHY